MKKYNSTWSCYGQCIASRIVYLQKMGIANGIMFEIKEELRGRKLNLNDWKHTEVIGNHSVTDLTLTVVFPTPSDYKELFDYPWFYYYAGRGIIDMLNVNDELSFHIMLFEHEKREFINGGWHTVREGLSLEDTCTLFEYVEDRKHELIVLSPDEHDKYNSTGALGVRQG